MPRKSTLVFVDDGQVKIVFGDKIKCVRFEDGCLDHNRQFIDKLFENTDVVRVESISRLSRDDMGRLFATEPSVSAAQARVPTPQPRQERKPIPMVMRRDGDSPSLPRRTGPFQTAREEQRTGTRTSDPITPKPSILSATGVFPQDGGDVYIMSNEKMTIIVDDLLTGQVTSRDGVEIPQTVVLFPGNPVNLSSVDKESLGKSKILPRLLRNGTVRQVSFDEAMAAMDLYEKRASEVISALDAPGMGIVGDGERGSARRMASGGMQERIRDFVDSGMPDVSDVAEEVEVSYNDPQVEPEAIDKNERSSSMADLMRQMDAAQAEGKLSKQTVPYKR